MSNAELTPGTRVRLLDPYKHAPRVRRSWPRHLFGREVVLDALTSNFWPCGEPSHLLDIDGFEGSWPDKAMEVVVELPPRRGPKERITCHRDGTVSFFNGGWERAPAAKVPQTVRCALPSMEHSRLIRHIDRHARSVCS